MEPEPHHLELIPLQPKQHHVTLLPKVTTDLPFFYLTKQKQQLSQPIRFESVDQQGRPMRWSVTPNLNSAIGAPAIEAHQVWVRLVMPVINLLRDSAGKIPSILPLGRMRESLRQVGWCEGGFEARRLLRALHQIGSAWCVGDFWMPTSQSDENGNPKFSHFQGAFSRMAIYAIGSKHVTDEQLAEGTFQFDFDLEDTLYVQLHPLEVSLQQNQPPRLVDNQYLFSVSPAARRWYELLAPKIFGALKHRREYCDVRYSWYVRHHHTLKRHTKRHRVLVQMNALITDHQALGYVERVEYLTVKEPGKEIDFIIRYYPGRGARESIERIRRAEQQRRSTIQIATYTDGEVGEVDDRYLQQSPVRKTRKPPEQGSAHPLLPELVRRGITASQARKLLESAPADQPVVDQLEWGDHLVQNAMPGEIHNPPGFYVYLLRDNVTVPDDFPTSRRRKLREEAGRAQAQKDQEEARLKLAYENYQESEIQHYIAANETEYESLLESKQQQFLGRDPDNQKFRPDTLKLIVSGIVRAAVKQRIAFTTFEAFCQEQANATPQPHTSPAPAPATDTPPLPATAQAPEAAGEPPPAPPSELPPQEGTTPTFTV